MCRSQAAGGKRRAAPTAITEPRPEDARLLEIFEKVFESLTMLIDGQAAISTPSAG